jgi:hypothetical protein
MDRECLAIDVAGGIRSGRVIDVLAQLVSVHGAPRYLRSDNGPEFVAAAILRWLADARIDTALIDPGKPWQNSLPNISIRWRSEGHLTGQTSASDKVPEPQLQPDLLISVSDNFPVVHPSSDDDKSPCLLLETRYAFRFRTAQRTLAD